MLVFINNVIVFVLCAIWQGIPPWRWMEAWDGVAMSHYQEVHKTIWELKIQGKVWEDENGYLHYRDK